MGISSQDIAPLSARVKSDNSSSDSPVIRTGKTLPVKALEPQVCSTKEAVSKTGKANTRNNSLQQTYQKTAVAVKNKKLSSNKSMEVKRLDKSSSIAKLKSPPSGVSVAPTDPTPIATSNKYPNKAVPKLHITPQTSLSPRRDSPPSARSRPVPIPPPFSSEPSMKLIPCKTTGDDSPRSPVRTKSGLPESPRHRLSSDGSPAKVKVIGRFRPLNKMEESLVQNNMGDVGVQFLDGTAVHIPSENQTFALDAIFHDDASQVTIYEQFGKSTILDVLSGYNGTIFAYGPTGSGKTYTMFGPDLFDEIQKGIIPRAASDVFMSWEENPDVKEVEIRCSMLEIYKENLRDLLTDEREELKIKESPTRGIYVEGLSERAIDSEQELLAWIADGEARRVWAETRHNLVSSRSHSIFMLEVRQILLNGSEKRGLLNLVDLAGSEKVGKTGAQGQLFEEGTKINLSLSALGNVIHALSSGLDHIPYRDSKLTRLLQESLGGNYKTTLIVTCSPHASQVPETISTLKFAQRAKKLKNKVQMNIILSPEQLLKMVELLKEQLKEKTLAIQKLMRGRPGEFIESPFDYANAPGRNTPKGEKAEANYGFTHKATCPSLPFRTSCPADSQIKKVILNSLEEVPETKLNRSQSVAMDDKSQSKSPEPQESKLMRLQGESESCLLVSSANENIAIKLHELEKENEKLKRLIVDKEATIERLRSEKQEIEKRQKKVEISLLEEMKKTVNLELEKSELELALKNMQIKTEASKQKSESENVQMAILMSQQRALAEALEDAESECLKLLKEKKNRAEMIETEIVKMNAEELSMKEKKREGVFTEKWVADIKSESLELESGFIWTKHATINLENPATMSESKYAKELKESILEGCYAQNAIVYLLKNKYGIQRSFLEMLPFLYINQNKYSTRIIEIGIINHNLKRVISLLIWKLHRERASANIKTEMGKVLQQTVDSLEALLSNSSAKHAAWKKKMERLDYHIHELKGLLEWKYNAASVGGYYCGASMTKIRIRKPIGRGNSKRNLKLGKGYLGNNGIMTSSSFLTPMARGSPEKARTCSKCIPGEEASNSKFKQANVFTDYVETEGVVEGSRNCRAVKQRQSSKELETVFAQNLGVPQAMSEKPADNAMHFKPSTLLVPSTQYQSASKGKGSEAPRGSEIVPIQTLTEEDGVAQEKMEYLEKNLQETVVELSWQKTLSNLAMEEMRKTRMQAEKLKQELQSVIKSAESQVLDENRHWQIAMESIKDNYDLELARKQKENAELHDLLARWIMKYMELEQVKRGGIGISSELNELMQLTTQKSPLVKAKISGIKINSKPNSGNITKK